MSNTGKIIFGIFLLIVAGFIYIVYDEMKYQEEISEVYDHDPSNFDFQKPVEYLEYRQRDSLNKLNVTEPKIEIIGTGYTVYDFYMWHQPREEGELYIKAFELTNNQQISKTKLDQRTKNIVDTISETFLLYKGRTTIDEGTFEKFYPVRFELWFNPENGNEIKLTEKKYLIDGWDR